MMSKKMFLAAAIVSICCTAKASEVKDTLVLTLNNALEIALNENPTIKIANQEIELKKVANSETWQNLLPTADLSATLNHTIKAAEIKLDDMSFKMGQDGSNTVNGALNIGLPLFAPSVYKAMTMTKKDIDLSIEKSRASKQDLINQVTKAYYQLLLAQDSYQVMQKSYDLSKENYDVVKAKYDQGKVSEYDKITAEVQLRSVKPSLVSASNAVTLSGLQLKVLMGIANDLIIKIDDSLVNYETTMLETTLNADQNSLENNTTMKQLKLNKEMLEQNIKTQRMSFLPTLGMNFSYQYQSLYNKNLKITDYKWSGGSNLVFSLNIPLYRAKNFTKMKTSKIQLAQLRLNQSDIERKLNMEVESYRNNMSASTEQVVSNKENVKQAQKALTIASKRYEVGNGTVLELNTSQVSLTQAQLVYNQSIYDYLVAKADLDKVLGVY